MIDVHCHLNFQAFENDYDQVIKDAVDAGVKTIINTGTQISSSQWAVDLAEKYDNLYAIVGIHPHHADKVALPHPNPLLAGEGTINAPSPLRGEGRGEGEKGWVKQLEEIAQHPKVLGIGEIGLDYFNYKSNGIVDQKMQREVFLTQIELASRLKIPIQIHNRLAGEDVIALLKSHRHLLQNVPGMFHCFAGTKQMLKDALDLGFFIGFDGNITYKGLAPGETVALKDLATLTPLDRIVIETDSPYLTPVPHRGLRNEPKYAIITADFIASLKGIPLGNLMEQTDKNVYTIFEKLKVQS